jgi:DNA invertase Pin-like site-specific DNA recombinase
MRDGSMTAVRNGGKRVGYKRVSTVDQTTVRQLDGVTLDKVFEDKLSGKDTQRPALQSAMDYLREGDVLVVHSLDRLARNLSDLLKLVEELNGRGVIVEFVKEGLTFGVGDTTPMAKLQLQMLGAFAEFERSLIRERQREGIAIAKAAGVYKGRARKFDAATIEVIRGRVNARENVSEIARQFGVSRPTIYRALGG